MDRGRVMLTDVDEFDLALGLMRSSEQKHKYGRFLSLHQTVNDSLFCGGFDLFNGMSGREPIKALR
jgi:hypothetical protein